LIFLLVGLYIVVKTVQGIIDLLAWLKESREMAKAQEAWKEKRRKEGEKRPEMPQNSGGQPGIVIPDNAVKKRPV